MKPTDEQYILAEHSNPESWLPSIAPAYTTETENGLFGMAICSASFGRGKMRGRGCGNPILITRCPRCTWACCQYVCAKWRCRTLHKCTRCHQRTGSCALCQSAHSMAWPVAIRAECVRARHHKTAAEKSNPSRTRAYPKTALEQPNPTEAK
jgi:hypothetical protein